jgi:hypothetical protein
MATRYWVGGSGSWTDTARWSATSGGAGGASVPGSTDDAIVNAASGTGTIGGYIDVGSLNMTGSTITGINGGINIYGTALAAMLIVPSNVAALVDFGFYNTVSKTVSITSTTYTGSFRFANSSGGVVLTSALNIAGTIDGSSGASSKFTSGNFAITCTDLNIFAADTVNFGSSAITINGTAQFGPITNFTHTGSLTLATNGSVGAQAIKASGQTFGSVYVSSYGSATAGGSTIPTISGFTCANLYLTQNIASVGGIPTIIGLGWFSGGTGTEPVTVTSIIQVTGSGEGNNRLQLRSATTGTAASLVLTGTTTRLFSYVDFTDIAITYSSNITGTSLGDCVGNSGITFRTPRTLYGSTAGVFSINWTSNSAWSLSSGGTTGEDPPLPQDSVILDANSQTFFYAPPANFGKNITVSNYTGLIYVDQYSSGNLQMRSPIVWGDITGDARCFVIQAFAGVSYLALGKRSAQTFTYNSAGSTSYSCDLQILPLADVTLASNCNLLSSESPALGTGRINVSGTLNLATYNLSCNTATFNTTTSTGGTGSSITFISGVANQPYLANTQFSWPNTSFIIHVQRFTTMTFPAGGSQTATFNKVILKNLTTAAVTDNAPGIYLAYYGSAVINSLERASPKVGYLPIRVGPTRTLTVGILATDGVPGSPTYWGNSTPLAMGTLAIAAANVNTQYTIFRRVTSSGGNIAAFGPMAQAGFNSSNIVQAGTYKALAFTGTGTSTFTVPADCSGQVTALVIGAGGGGGKATVGTARGFSGGAGAGTSVSLFLNVSAGQTIYYSSPTGGAGSTLQNTSGTAGGSAWLSTFSNSTPSATTYGASAQGGFPGQTNSSVGGTGLIGHIGKTGGSSTSSGSQRGGTGGASPALLNTDISYSAQTSAGLSFGSGGGSLYGDGQSNGTGGANSLGANAAINTAGTLGGGGGGSNQSHPATGANGANSEIYAYDFLNGSAATGFIGAGGGGGGGISTLSSSGASGGGVGGIGAGGGGSGGQSSGTVLGNGGNGGPALVMFFYSTTSTNRASSSFIG